MATLISKELYERGYRLEGEGRRVDIIDSENKKHLEIFFFPDNILIMDQYEFRWVKSIVSIGLYAGLPEVEVLLR